MLKLVFSSYRRKNIYIIFILLFIFSYLILDFLWYELDFYNKEIYEIKNKISNRTLIIDIDEINAEKYLNVEQVEDFYPLFNNQMLIIEDIIYYINYDNNFLVNKGEIALSKTLRTSINYEKLNQSIDMYINGNSYNYKVISEIENNHADFYMNLNEFKELFNLNDNKYCVILRKNISSNDFIKYMSKLNFQINYKQEYGQNEVNQLENIKRVYLIFITIIGGLLIFFANNIIKNIILKEKKDIAIFKAIGYKRFYITIIIFLRILFTIFISFLISLIFDLMYSIQNFLGTLQIKLLTTFILILVTIINLIINDKRIKMLNVFEALQDS